jgi:hypothetical protein
MTLALESVDVYRGPTRPGNVLSRRLGLSRTSGLALCQLGPTAVLTIPIRVTSSVNNDLKDFLIFHRHRELALVWSVFDALESLTFVYPQRAAAEKGTVPKKGL